MSHWSIVPVRGLATGKSRLAELLDAKERRALNAMLLGRVLDAIERCYGDLSRCIVASAGGDALEIAQGRAALPMADAGDSGLNAALEAARDAARARGATTILVLVADLPGANSDALARFRDSTPPRGAAIIADKQGTGTNGLLLPADCRANFAFGEASLERHRRAIAAAGIDVSVWSDPALSFDIDTPSDYREWQLRLAKSSSATPGTGSTAS